MPRIRPVVAADTDARTAATLNGVKARLGRLPNLLLTLAQSPAVLQGYVSLSSALAAGRLTARQREVIALAVSQVNDCDYCLSAHSAIGRAAGLNDTDLAAARAGRGADAFEGALAALAAAVVRDRGRIPDHVLEAARAAGLDDGLVIEVIGHAALTVLTNLTNNVAGTEIDFPVAEPLAV